MDRCHPYDSLACKPPASCSAVPGSPSIPHRSMHPLGCVSLIGVDANFSVLLCSYTSLYMSSCLDSGPYGWMDTGDGDLHCLCLKPVFPALWFVALCPDVSSLDPNLSQRGLD